jgi:hypothetical protein
VSMSGQIPPRTLMRTGYSNFGFGKEIQNFINDPQIYSIYKKKLRGRDKGWYKVMNQLSLGLGVT